MATKKQNPLYNTGTGVVGTIKGGTSLGTNATKDSLISAANPTITPVVKPVVTNTVQNSDVVNTPQNGTQNQKISSTTNDNTQKGITTPTTQNEPTFDLQKAQEAEAKLASGQIQTLGQKSPEQKLQESNPAYGINGTGVVDSTGKVIEPTPKIETPTTDKLLEEQNKTIADTQAKEKAQEEILLQNQSNIAKTDAEIKQQSIDYQNAQNEERIKWRDNRLLEIDKQSATLTENFQKELLAAGLTTTDTASMNADLRQKYNAYTAGLASLQSESSVLKGNLNDARSATEKYYSTISGYIQDRISNYKTLLDSSSGELNRLTGIEKSAIENKIKLLQGQLDIENQKQKMQETVLSAPIDVQNKAKNKYGLSLTDTAETQYAKLQSAQNDVDNINALIKAYPDLIGVITANSSDTEIQQALEGSDLYNAAVTKNSGSTTKNILARSNELAKLLNKDYGTIYPNITDALGDAQKIAYMEYKGMNTEEAKQMVLNGKTKSATEVNTQLSNISAKTASLIKGTDTLRNDTKKRLDSTYKSGNYTGFAQDAISTAINSQTGDTKSSIISSGYLMSISNFISDDLKELYRKYGTSSKIDMAIGNDMLSIIGEGIVDSEGKALIEKINSEISLAIQSYTKSVSGAAFSAQEFQRYKDVFPSSKNSIEVNNAKLESLRDTGTNNYYNALGVIMGADNIATLKTIASTNTTFANSYVQLAKESPNTIISDSIAASLGVNGNYINRIKGGQCGAYVNRFLKENGLNIGFTDSAQSKIDTVKNNGGYTEKEDIINQTPKVGDIIVQTFPNSNTDSDAYKYGHVAIVSGFDSATGDITLTESNYYGDETISFGRKVNITNIAGLLPLKQ